MTGVKRPILAVGILEAHVIDIEKRDLLKETEHARLHAQLGDGVTVGRGRQYKVDVVVVLDCQAQLLEVVGTLDAPGRLAGRLDGGKQQGNQYGDDCDHHQQFDQGETASSGEAVHSTPLFAVSDGTNGPGAGTIPRFFLLLDRLSPPDRAPVGFGCVFVGCSSFSNGGQAKLGPPDVLLLQVLGFGFRGLRFDDVFRRAGWIVAAAIAPTRQEDKAAQKKDHSPKIGINRSARMLETPCHSRDQNSALAGRTPSKKYQCILPRR